MFGARKKFVEFVEVVDNDFPDESMYYNQPSMFPHRSDKDVSFPLAPASVFRRALSGHLNQSLSFSPQMLSSPSPSSSSQLSQLGASLYAPQSRCFISAITVQLHRTAFAVTSGCVVHVFP